MAANRWRRRSFASDLEHAIPSLRRLARALLRDPDGADDRVQDHARLSPRAPAQSVFADAPGRRTTFHFARSRAPRPTALLFVAQDGVGAFCCDDGTVGHTLVGPTDRDRPPALARLVDDQLDAPSVS